MASKKLTKEWLRRSRAAKKGWASRKQKKVLSKKLSDTQKKLRNAQLGLPKKQRKRIPKILASKRSIEELEEILRRKDEEIRILKKTRNWVNAMPDELLHSDGTIALQPSRARHRGKLTEMAIRRMKLAMKKGEHVFDRTVRQLADFFQLPVREIYTLHYSP